MARSGESLERSSAAILSCGDKALTNTYELLAQKQARDKIINLATAYP